MLELNIVEARKCLDVFASSLGPNAMHKLVSTQGTITVDGGTIAHHILRQPGKRSAASRLALAAASQQGFRCGDGVCTLAVLASGLLRAMEQLLRQGFSVEVLLPELDASLAVAVTACSADTKPLPKITTSSLVEERVALALQAHADMPASVQSSLLTCFCSALGVGEEASDCSVEALQRLDFLAIPGVGSTEVL